MPPPVATGLLAGAAIALLTALVEHSRIGVGDYALYGNGALVVPAILAPWALYWGWTWALARGGRALELALFVLGLHFGVGMWALIDTLFYAQEPGLSVVDALPGVLLLGTILVVPAALLAGATYWLFASGRLTLGAVTLFAAAFVAAVLVVFYWIGLGIFAGITVDAARRDPSRHRAIGIALLILLVVVANLPYLPALFSGQG